MKGIVEYSKTIKEITNPENYPTFYNPETEEFEEGLYFLSGCYVGIWVSKKNLMTLHDSDTFISSAKSLRQEKFEYNGFFHGFYENETKLAYYYRGEWHELPISTYSDVIADWAVKNDDGAWVLA